VLATWRERSCLSLFLSLSLSLSLSCSLLLSSMGVLVERSSPTASRHVLRLDRDIGDPPHLILFVWLSVVISQIFRNIQKSRDGSHVHSRLPACSGFILSPFVIEIASASRSVRHISSVPVNLSLSVIVLRDFWIRIVCETSILFDETEPSTARILAAHRAGLAGTIAMVSLISLISRVPSGSRFERDPRLQLHAT